MSNEAAETLSAGEHLSSCRRVVVKIGSALLAHDDGRLRADWIDGLARDVAELCNTGVDVMIVSSGAIAVGRRLLGLARGPRNQVLRLDESQAAAATGQVQLAHAWQEALARHGVKVAQILLTTDDTE
ncbi:MAG: glutamate 5-kinase, partial [Alphaproteobacteria bacterium]